MRIRLMMIQQDLIQFFKDTLPMKIAFKLPKSIQLWCFVLVYGADGNCPSDEYKEKYDHWTSKHKLKRMS